MFAVKAPLLIGQYLRDLAQMLSLLSHLSLKIFDGRIVILLIGHGELHELVEGVLQLLSTILLWWILLRVVIWLLI